MALGFMRRHRRWLYVFLWIVIAAFIILYIPAFQGDSAGSPGQTLAKVGEEPISVGEFQRAYLRQRQFYERLYQGRKLDSAMLKRLGLEEQVLQGLVEERLVLLEARRLGITVPDSAVARMLATSPEFQENGRFMGGAEIKRRLEMQGVSVPEFEESLRRRMLREQLEGLVTQEVGVSPAEAEREYRRRNEQVKAEYVLVDASRFRNPAKIGDEEVKARFESKREAYRLPEKRVASYISIDAEALRPRITVTDRDLEAYYQQHRDEFKEEEQACASHILVKVSKDAKAKEGHADADAQKLAAALLQEVKAGSDFAALAKKSSEDQGSAANGGDLGCFPRGRMVPQFDEAVFSMEAGKTSELVKSPFGYHIIKLVSRREEQVPTLSVVKERIRPLVTNEKVEALAGQKTEAVAASLAKGRSLEDAAKENGLAVQKSAPVARGEVKEPLASASLVARLFEIKPGAIEKEGFAVPRGAVFVALAEVQPSRLPDQKDVQDKVKADLVEENAFTEAAAMAADLKARAQKTDLDKAAAAMSLVRKESPGLVGRGQPLGDLGSGAALEEAVFSLPEKTLSEPVRVTTGYAVVRVLEKKAFDPEAFTRERGSLIASMKQQKQGQLFQSYLGQARDRYTIERKADAFKRVMGQER
jgi:peptidyl-prolyl cis-trans isomerase D